ncbi:hypothetical protein AOQ84DRAFT_291217, partial [Glonium stellatum]
PHTGSLGYLHLEPCGAVLKDNAKGAVISVGAISVLAVWRRGHRSVVNKAEINVKLGMQRG